MAADTAPLEQIKKTSGHAACPSCGAAETDLFYALDNVPTNSCILFSTKEEALACKTGEMRLCHCPDCGFIFNAAFTQELTEYSGRYEETQGFSPTFSKFHTNLAKRLIERHDIHGRNVMEIGCGKGEFLVLLSQLGENTGIGVDPSAIPERLEGVEGAERVTLIPEYFDPSHCAREPDFLCCKMTLEHITNTAQFIRQIRDGLTEGGGTTVFFQIPESLRILRHCAFEDIYYEHCSYFTPGSLGRLFRSCGFRVTDISTEYDDQYLTIEAVPGFGGEMLEIEDDLDEIASLVETFPKRVEAAKHDWQGVVDAAKGRGETVLLWGSGSKAVSFLTSLGLGDKVDHVTDINPNRHNHYMPGTGQRIVPPAELAEIKPDLVIVMNRIYEDEITADLKALGLSPTIKCL
ncbi:MAG: class I SAM-dependent methyltransferase [Henriciella sp.]|uniref:class I SAM-dependent methyltransferase n=1 Tax=Henriciella sp. TaxID=1968823 RepID=UPI00260BB442|nr:class I SAM-dependent methyltransferase [Henriciella sp.]